MATELTEGSVPGVEEYRALRVITGLSPKTAEAAAAGLPNTLYSVTVRDADTLIGMGRVVGDAGLNFDIVDVAVHPDYQRQGIGKAIMTSLMNYIDRTAHHSAYVSLLADDGAPALYEKFGFRLTAPRTVGMALNVTRDE